MAAIIVADSLYSKQPCVEKLTAGRFSFLLVAKPGDHINLCKDVAGLRRGNLLDRHQTVHRGERREYEWVTGLPLNGSPTRRSSTSSSSGSHGKVTYSESPTWCPPPDHQLVHAARALEDRE